MIDPKLPKTFRIRKSRSHRTEKKRYNRFDYKIQPYFEYSATRMRWMGLVNLTKIINECQHLTLKAKERLILTNL